MQNSIQRNIHRSVQPFPLVCYFMHRYLESLRWKKIRICRWQSLEKDPRSSYMELHLQPGTGSYAGLSALLGGGMSGFPSFDAVAVQRIDYVMMLVYMFCGCVLAYFYETTHTVTEIIAGKIPGVVKEILAGLCLGVIGMLIPAVMFSGEEQMGVLMKEYAGYMAIVLIGVAFLKVLLTNLCIQFGLKGGHFFPVIFAGVCLGYGLAMLFFGQQGDSHVVFAAAIVTSTLLGGIMKKPLAVTMLLFLCFPVKIFIWIFIAAAVGSKCVKKLGKEV